MFVFSYIIFNANSSSSYIFCDKSWIWLNITCFDSFIIVLKWRLNTGIEFFFNFVVRKKLWIYMKLKLFFRLQKAIQIIICFSSRSIVRTETFSSFFRGLTPTLIQIAPNVGCQFFFYEFFTNLYKQYSHQTNETCVSATNSLISGSMAGVLAKTVTYPFDLVRRRMQIQNFEHGRKGFGEFFFCSGMIDCLVRTTKREGIAGLFKGFVPSQLKAAIVSALYFTFYEQSLQFLQLRHEWRICLSVTDKNQFLFTFTSDTSFTHFLSSVDIFCITIRNLSKNFFFQW